MGRFCSFIRHSSLLVLKFCDKVSTRQELTRIGVNGSEVESEIPVHLRRLRFWVLSCGSSRLICLCWIFVKVGAFWATSLRDSHRDEKSSNFESTRTLTRMLGPHSCI